MPTSRSSPRGGSWQRYGSLCREFRGKADREPGVRDTVPPFPASANLDVCLHNAGTRARVRP
ncbi:hypothetical protein FRACA_340005 [Frankia canadensis]|uniref:Uncharacterized protein n=1 Tax=Frankia canadensis TaxID=1836972 RepID=A0A2I2KV07_9ACTN|nr:hypothetical protein FRACA_340005 [Frankia canadensis]SOU56785.1 hypothetical protein FRACA_340005 [Frankia canadensis]